MENVIPEPIATDYAGRLMVFNCMPDDAAELLCIHQSEQADRTTRIGVPVLAAHTASDVQVLHSATWEVDTWSLMFCIGRKWYVRGGKFCDIYRSDANGLCLVTLVKAPGEHYRFSIVPPVSSSCLKNRYMIALEDELPVEEDEIPGIEEDYTGKFAVINATSAAISDIQIKHVCSDREEPFKILSLQKNGVSEIYPINCVTGNADYWSVAFEQGGKRKYRNGKKCDYTTEDLLCTCLIILYDNDFSILTPWSDPCLNNHYED